MCADNPPYFRTSTRVVYKGTLIAAAKQLIPLSVAIECGLAKADGTPIEQPKPELQAPTVAHQVKPGKRVASSPVKPKTGSRVDFIIVSYNSTRDVGRLLLQLSMTVETPHTVTVVDNSFVNRGFSKAANLGAAQGSAETVAFLNPDLFLVPGWMDETVAALAEDPQLVIAGPRLDDGIPWPRDLQWAGLKSWVCGACFFVRRDFFESCGGFDERYFFSCEESDLCRQAQERKLHVQTVGEPRIKHLRSGTQFHDDELRKSAKQYKVKWS